MADSMQQQCAAVCSSVHATEDRVRDRAGQSLSFGGGGHVLVGHNTHLNHPRTGPTGLIFERVRIRSIQRCHCCPGSGGPRVVL